MKFDPKTMFCPEPMKAGDDCQLIMRKAGREHKDLVAPINCAICNGKGYSDKGECPKCN